MVKDTQTPWKPYFAIIPVRVDAYSPDEIRNGKMSYLQVGWVERCFATWIDVDDEDQEEHRVWKYRLARK